MIIWVIAGLLGLATGLRIGWALVNKQSLVSTAMILALGSLGVIAALNWQPLTLLIDTLLRWPNISMGLSQVALVACAAGSCVMITTVSSARRPATIRKVAIAQYSVAAVIAVVSLVSFFAAGRQPEMSPQEYLRRNLDNGGYPLPWLLPLLYVLLALSLVAWAGLRHSNRTRRGRALFVFTIGIVLIVAAAGFFLLRAAGRGGPVGVGAAATLLGCAMLVVAAGALLPSVEDWFGARRELRVIQPILTELGRRHPDIGIGVRPRGPLVFRVAERMSLISDALFLEATAADYTRKLRVDSAGAPSGDDADSQEAELESPSVSPKEQAQAIAEWIYAGREAASEVEQAGFPGLGWLRQPSDYSDREWILEIAEQYRALTRRGGAVTRPA
ncbi:MULTISPECIES: hypothetical protein [unclassified Mycobacterium]|uniref:hypothetical protein n=1 Tax=unclassified Mycobacterium TaxID=2642494 RepID=UPI0007404F6F|nr:MULTISPECIES: hypothetical protein [unclassified Mycobacterium]KUH85794.1 hypothetical protein AU186_24040 [Mycobacterium sp. GA-1999]KUH91650.1 hypothetical protein AU185_11105 [Mycobacterium sp. GA-0227b]KUH96110.1 hypothetical protein AU187_12825 [Mycobacterium sp. IS-1556]